MKKINNKNNLPVIANFGGFIERNCHGDYAEIVRKKNASTTSFPRSKILGKISRKQMMEYLKELNLLKS